LSNTTLTEKNGGGGGNQRKTSDLCKLTDKFYNKELYEVQLSMTESEAHKRLDALIV